VCADFWGKSAKMNNYPPRIEDIINAKTPICKFLFYNFFEKKPAFAGFH